MSLFVTGDAACLRCDWTVREDYNGEKMRAHLVLEHPDWMTAPIPADGEARARANLAKLPPVLREGGGA